MRLARPLPRFYLATMLNWVFSTTVRNWNEVTDMYTSYQYNIPVRINFPEHRGFKRQSKCSELVLSAARITKAYNSIFLRLSLLPWQCFNFSVKPE